MIRCKFSTIEIAKVNTYDGHNTIIGERITLIPVSGNKGEDLAFGEATPSGELKIIVSKQNLFEMNKKYYVDFTLSEKE